MIVIDIEKIIVTAGIAIICGVLFLGLLYILARFFIGQDRENHLIDKCLGRNGFALIILGFIIITAAVRFLPF